MNVALEVLSRMSAGRAFYADETESEKALISQNFVRRRVVSHSISFHLFADNIAIYKAGTVISRLQVTTGQ